MITTPKFETEIFRRVYSNDDGYYYQIGPDADGLGCISVTYVDENSKRSVNQQIVCAPECAELIGQAMIDCARELKVKDI